MRKVGGHAWWSPTVTRPDTIRVRRPEGKQATFEALRTRCDADGPDLRPRISGVVEKDGAFCLSILKSADGDPECNHRYFYGAPTPPCPAEGRFIHTYQETLGPLPSFEGEPRLGSHLRPRRPDPGQGGLGRT